MNLAPQRFSILIVDDDPDLCWALERFIKSEGAHCIVVNSALEALMVVGDNIFGLAFVDVKLPDMDGLDLVREMHILAPTLPCILVSGYLYDDDDHVQDSLASGHICGFIPKPFQLNQIKKAIQQFQPHD